MHTTTERILLLKSASIFSETPDDILAEIAGFVEELEFPAGQTIFEKGDLGTSMYIIMSGKVRVHDGERTLNYIEKGNVFGEMAALDPMARSASVTPEVFTCVLRLEREPLVELMAERPEVARGIIHILVQHVRARVRDMHEDYVYMQQFARVTAAAAALEAGVYDPESITEVGQRTDQLGQLARVFQRMAAEVYAREQRLKQEVQELRIQIDEAKKANQVAEIAGSDYFKHLREEAQKMRAGPRAKAQSAEKAGFGD